jgi:hypothetical protein
MREANRDLGEAAPQLALRAGYRLPRGLEHLVGVKRLPLVE